MQIHSSADSHYSNDKSCFSLCSTRTMGEGHIPQREAYVLLLGQIKGGQRTLHASVNSQLPLAQNNSLCQRALGMEYPNPFHTQSREVTEGAFTLCLLAPSPVPLHCLLSYSAWGFSGADPGSSPLFPGPSMHHLAQHFLWHGAS